MDLIVLYIAGDCSATFTASGTFLPCRVGRVRVLAVGGGSGGLSGNCGGGGSGYVRSGEYSVTLGQSVPVAVGSGGDGSTGIWDQNSKAGGTSSFGAFLSAAGGEGRSGNGNLAGAVGGSVAAKELFAVRERVAQEAQMVPMGLKTRQIPFVV